MYMVHTVNGLWDYMRKFGSLKRRYFKNDLDAVSNNGEILQKVD